MDMSKENIAGIFSARFWIFIILGTFLVLGLSGIFYNFGMQESVGDESVLTTTTLKMIAEKKLTPSDPFNYHMPLGPYVYLPFFVFILAALRLSGAFPDTEMLIALGVVDWAVFLPLARFISVVLGAISVYLLYLCAVRLFNNRRIALLAAFIFSMSMMFVKLAHFGKVWALQIATLLLAFYFISIILKDKHAMLYGYVRVGFGVGLAFMSHAIGVLIGVSFIVAHILKTKVFGSIKTILFDRRFIITLIIIVLALPFSYILNPYGVENYFSRSLTTVSGGVAADVLEKNVRIENIATEKFLFYPRVLAEYDPLILLFGLASLFLLFRKERDSFFIITAFIATYYLFIGPILGGNGLRFEPRFALPLIPFLSLSAAFGINCVLNRLATHNILRRITLISFLILFSFGAFLWTWAFLRPNTADLAEDWILHNLPEGTRIVHYDRATPIPLPENIETLEDTRNHNPTFFTTARAFLSESNPEQYYTDPTYYVLLAPHYDKIGVPEAIIEKGFDYMILNWWTLEDRQRALDNLSFLDFENVSLIKRFPEDGFEDGNVNVAGKLRNPYKTLPGLTHTGPVIEIFKLKNANEE